ncbi:MAG: hypothetical protein VX616_07320, partial [Actinomycetota bacterium]|nr:hypothetical protein [Actinomycetota bacterium]
EPNADFLGLLNTVSSWRIRLSGQSRSRRTTEPVTLPAHSRVPIVAPVLVVLVSLDLKGESKE